MCRKKSQRHKAFSGQSIRTAETYSEISVNTIESGRGITRSSAFISAQPELILDGSLKNHAPKHSHVDKVSLSHFAKKFESLFHDI